MGINDGEKKALLVLADGTYFAGDSFGSQNDALGELVFNTSMTGYQEALTDPSYAGQILTFAYPLIGNYGISREAVESGKIHPKAVVVKEWCKTPSTHRQSIATISDFLYEQGVPGISGVDTREIVTKIRSSGVLPSAIVHADADEIGPAVLKAQKMIGDFDYAGTDFVKEVTRSKAEEYESAAAIGTSKHHVALLDCGAKMNIIRNLNARGCDVTVFPVTASSDEILYANPDGLMISNGPGDPALMTYAIRTCKGILGKMPVFGICLGHQILGHALGAKTRKLKFGHRGANQPVMDLKSGKSFLTSQNHGYEVYDLPKGTEEWMKNLNDGSNEGLRCPDKNAFSVQFHPEASPGPCDTEFLFDEFVGML